MDAVVKPWPKSSPAEKSALSEHVRAAPEPTDAGDVSGKTKNFRVVDVVNHDFPIRRRWRARIAVGTSFIRSAKLYIMLTFRERQGNWRI